ncbi:MAG: WG repeat-containing protein [Flavobacteriales bacterium]|jgi:hypothetical protein|nr:WG repeat-containing protein [Flavobacteriales bacterium]
MPNKFTKEVITIVITLMTFAPIWGQNIRMQKYFQEQSYFPYRIGDKWGFSDGFGKIKVSPQFDRTFPSPLNSYDEYPMVVLQNNAYFFWNKKEKNRDTTGYKHIKQDYPLGYRITPFEGEKFCLDFRKKPIDCSTIFCGGSYSGSDFHFYKVGNKYGIAYNNFNLKKIKLPAVWDSYNLPRESAFAVVESNGKKGLINKLGKLIVPLHYDEMDYLNHSAVLIVKYQDKYGVINKKNEVVIPFKYDSIRREHGTFRAQKGNLSYYYSPVFIKLYQEE